MPIDSNLLISLISECKFLLSMLSVQGISSLEIFSLLLFWDMMLLSAVADDLVPLILTVGLSGDPPNTNVLLYMLSPLVVVILLYNM